MLCFSKGDGLTMLCFFPTPCSCVILTHTYHWYHYFTMFRQILVAGIGSEMEIWGCHEPGLKWLSFNGLCEIGGWAWFICWLCPHYELVRFVFPTLCRPAAAGLLIPHSWAGGWVFSVSSHQAFRSAWSRAWWFGEVWSIVPLAGSKVAHIFFPCWTSHRGQ